MEQSDDDPFLNMGVTMADFHCADTLRYSVTFTFILLTLNIRRVSSVRWSNYVPNFGEIEQLAAEL